MSGNRAGSVTPVTAAAVTFAIIIMVTLMAFPRASAQVVLKPRGQEAAPLRLKAMVAKVRLQAVQFATTDLDLTFQNEQGERIEADFLYTVPDGAVVTDFAYFFGAERVPARIAEKERAAAIYQHITSRMRDPALVEMIGRNTFRARIFPVMPNADLRVQIRYLQVLPVQAGNTVTYSLPLKADKANRLEKVSVDIEASASDSETRLMNNFGLPFRRSAGALRLTFSGSQYRVNRDLRITRSLPKVALQAHCLAARSGGTDGFFALALAGPTRLRPERVHIDGAATYDVESVPSGTSGTGLLVTGRYRGSGHASVTITDGQGKPLSSLPLEFSSKAVANGPASKLWAGARIAHLSADSRNRPAVVALSHRFGLPSRWTSWIAIPEEERQRYEQEKIAADAEIIAGRLARLIEQRKGESAAANRLREEFRRLYRGIDSSINVEDALREHLQAALENTISRAAQDVAQGVAAGTGSSPASRRARARLHDLCKLLNAKPDNVLNNALHDERWRLQEQVVELVARGRDRTPSGRLTWQQLRTVDQAVHADSTAQVREAVNQQLRDVAERWVVNERGKTVSYHWSGELEYGPPLPRLSAERRSELQSRLNRLARSAQRNVSEVIEEAQTPYRLGEMLQLRDQIITTRKQKPMDLARVSELEARFLAEARSNRQKWTSKQHRYYYKSNTPEQREVFARDRLARIAARTEGDQLDIFLETPPSGSDVAALRARREALRQREEELRVRMGDPLVSVEAPADAQAVVARMPDGTFLPLIWNAEANRWQARFDVATSATEGTYEVNVSLLLQDGTRRTNLFRYTVDLTAPQGTARVTRVNDGSDLRLEINASPDTARVLALLPGDKTVSLSAAANNPGHFVALAPSAFTPGDTITFILTDRAHNRTVLTVTTVFSEARP